MAENTPTSSGFTFWPGLENRQTDASSYFAVGLFVVAAFSLFLYLKVLRKKKSTNHYVPIDESHVEGINEENLFLSMQNELTDAPGTRGLPTGQRLTVTFSTHDKIFNSTVINNSDECFVITLPHLSEEEFTPLPEDVVKIYAVREGRHLSFTSSVLQVFTGGLRACSLKHTSEVSASNRRRDARVSGDGPALFTFFPETLINGDRIPLLDLQSNILCEIPATIQDISHGGCALRTRSPLHVSPGDLIYFNACLPETEHEISSVGYIIASKGIPRENGGGSMFSVEFLAPEDEMLQLIDEHVFQRLDEEVIE